MAANPPTIFEASISRPWFKKKRYVIPLTGVLLIGFVVSLGDTTPVEAPEGEATQVLSEGIMPDYLGYTALQVAETLQELDIREMDVDWPRVFGGPSSEDFEEDADLWIVCEQDPQPGDELGRSPDLSLGWAKDCSDYKVVPDLVGLAGRDAYYLAKDRGLSIDGYSSGSDGDRTVCAQKTPVGVSIPAGLSAKNRSEDALKLALSQDCEQYYERLAAREAEERQREQERAERAERDRILADPNTFEGGRRFINYHSEWLGSDIALIDAYRSWLEAGAVIDDPNSFGGPILDALFGDIPYMPKVTDRMWEEAPDDFQERWDDICQRLDEADEAHDEAATLRRQDIYSTSEELPYIAAVRALTAEALRLVESIPYPQQ